MQKRITDFCHEMDFLFDYQNFDRAICYCKEQKEGIAAEVKTDIEYRRMTIHLYPSFFTHSIKDQRELLLHEFCHTFTDKIYCKAINLLNGKFETNDTLQMTNEEATSRITNVLHGLLIGRTLYAKKAYAKYLE